MNRITKLCTKLREKNKRLFLRRRKPVVTCMHKTTSCQRQKLCMPWANIVDMWLLVKQDYSLRLDISVIPKVWYAYPPGARNEPSKCRTVHFSTALPFGPNNSIIQNCQYTRNYYARRVCIFSLYAVYLMGA